MKLHKNLKLREVFDLLEEHGGQLESQPYIESVPYFKSLLKTKQYISFEDIDENVISFATYYKVNSKKDLKEIFETDLTWQLPSNYTKGKYIFVDTMVIKPKSSISLRHLIKVLHDKEPDVKGAFWIRTNDKWYYYKRKQKVDQNAK